ncbi:MAG: TetR/AcrR family transcriptional regulator [Hyphomonas sp.]
MPDTKTDRRTAILDAAEAQFARHGYDGVNLRAIAREAGVDVALANYHFGKKQDLFDAVLMRRAEVLNGWRLKALTDAMAKASPAAPSVEAIVRAYLGPLLTGPHVAESGWRHYYALIAYVNNSPEWGGKLMTQFFDPLIRRFIDALRMSLAPVDEKSLYWSYHCFSGALTLTFAQTGRIDQLSRGLCHSDDLDDAYEHVVQFITAGFEALKADR